MGIPLMLRHGAYGRSKYKVMSLLATVSASNNGAYLSIRRIAAYTGIPYNSLAIMLKQYTKYSYIKQQNYQTPGEGKYEYAILQKGENWLHRAENELQAAGQFDKELLAQIEKTRPVINSLVKLPFKRFVREYAPSIDMG